MLEESNNPLRSCWNKSLCIIKQKLGVRSEEHTSELQSPCNFVCRLLLEKTNAPPTYCRSAGGASNRSRRLGRRPPRCATSCPSPHLCEPPCRSDTSWPICYTTSTDHAWT